MRKKLIVAVLFFLALVVIFLMRLYQPTSMNEELKQATPAQQELKQPSVNEPWKNFSAATFTIQLPSLPQHVSEKVSLSNSQDLVKYDMYLVQQPVGSTFMISLIHYPESFDTSDATSVLESITKEMLSNNSESKLLSSLHGQFCGKPSIDNVIANSSLYVYMRAFISGKTLYVINVVDQEDVRAKSHFDKALASFHLNDS